MNCDGKNLIQGFRMDGGALGGTAASPSSLSARGRAPSRVDGGAAGGAVASRPGFVAATIQKSFGGLGI